MSNKKNPNHGDTVVGKYQASGRGFGFLVPEDGKGREDDYFIPPRCDGGAWNGDTVAVLPDLSDDRGERRTAGVVSILKRGNPVVTGTLSKEGRELWLTPDNDRLPAPIAVIGKGRGAKAGDKVALSMTSFGGGKYPPMGSVEEAFGKAGTRETSVKAILYNYEIDRDFPVAVTAQAEEIPQQVEESALVGRVDLRKKCTITIDGATSKDLDDAISLEKDEGGNWILGVHIAHVSHYVTERTPLDAEAFERGTSVYFADQVIPMLPKVLSNGICSLNPQVDRLALSCTMTIDKAGTVVEHKIEKSVICTTERMTYEDCNTLLAGTSQPLADHYAHILPMLREMGVLAKVLAKKRRLRGSLDLEMGESYIVCGGDGTPLDIVRRTQGESEALIESFMLAANECVAEHLAGLKKPAVYRVHEKPSTSKSEALQAMMAPLHIDLQNVDNFSLQKILDEVKDKPEAPMVHAMVLRSLMKARYDVQNLGHFGLAAKYYCHFTSPIRRYPDLMIHRILTALAEGKLEGDREKKLTASALRSAQQSSEREIAAQNAEREIEKLYMAEYMVAHVGERFPATVAGVTKSGLFVALSNGVEGFLPAHALPDDRYSFDELRMTLRGMGGNAFTFGMALEVLCAAANPAIGTVDFVLPNVQVRSPSTRTIRTSAPEKERTPQRRKKGGRPAMHVPKRGKGRKKR